MTFVAAVNSYDRQAYFYADATFNLGDISKQPNDAILVHINYQQITPSIIIDDFSFQIDVGSNPPLMVASAVLVNNVLTFIISEGLPGTTYNLSVITDHGTDILTIDVPLEEQCAVVGTVINQVPVWGIDNIIFVNASPKYNIGPITPSGASVMDQWYNTVTKILSEFVTDGTNTWWQPL